MAGRLGIDFGTSNTVVSIWDAEKRDSRTVNLSDYARAQESTSGRVYTIPSVIHYLKDGGCLVGEQVIRKNLLHSNRTFQWMKRYICRRTYMDRLIDGQQVTFFDAGERFLGEIVRATAAYMSGRDEEIAMTVPVEAFEDYSNWLAKIVYRTELYRFRVLDEPSAAGFGYGTRFNLGDTYLVFDFGGGTLDIAIVRIDSSNTVEGQYCNVLGKAGAELGGTTIDGWIFNEVLNRSGLAESDEQVKAIGRLLLSECERVKEALSFNEKATLDVLNPITGSLLSTEFTQRELEDLLDAHDAFAQIDRAVRRALKDAESNGLLEQSIDQILMVGGSSLIPSVQKYLRRIFGSERVRVSRPLDAVASGASAFVAGVAFHDYIQHDYAIRYVNPKTEGYEYRSIVKRGTRYPTNGYIAGMKIKASFDGQLRMGIPIFEIGGSTGISGEQRVEVYFDETGSARIMTTTEKEFSRKNFFWINEGNPTFLRADPPGVKGEPRFNVSFSIDENRRLLITAVDLKSNDTLLHDYPVVKLT
jgi:molecular chaperone DnaK (HSP70)